MWNLQNRILFDRTQYCVTCRQSYEWPCMLCVSGRQHSTLQSIPIPLLSPLQCCDYGWWFEGPPAAGSFSAKGRLYLWLTGARYGIAFAKMGKRKTERASEWVSWSLHWKTGNTVATGAFHTHTQLSSSVFRIIKQETLAVVQCFKLDNKKLQSRSSYNNVLSEPIASNNYLWSFLVFAVHYITLFYY